MSLEQLDIPLSYDLEKTSQHRLSILKLRYASTLGQSPDLKLIFEQFDAPVHLIQSHVDSIQQHLIGS